MWWAAVPAGAIVTACLAGASLVFYVSNSLFLKNPYKRSLASIDEVHHYLRDRRISGNPYKQFGLEHLSLEEEK